MLLKFEQLKILYQILNVTKPNLKVTKAIWLAIRHT